MSKQSIKKNGILYTIKAISSLLLPLITFPYASRILTPTGIGKVNFVLNIISYFSLFAGLGVHSYSIREATKIRDDRIALSQFMQEVTLIRFVSTLVFFILFLTSLFIIPKFADYLPMFFLASFNLFFSFLDIGWIYHAEEEFEFITIRTLLFQFLTIIILFTLVKTKDDLIKYLGINILTTVGANLLSFIYAKKYVYFLPKQKLAIKQHLKPIFLFWSINLVSSIYTMLDTTMLGFLTNDTEIGFYSASTKLSHMVLTLITSLTTVLLPRLSYYKEKKLNDDLYNLFNKALAFSLFLSLPCTLGLIILSRPLILALSGTAYLPAVPVMKTISPIIIMISTTSLVGSVFFTAINKEKYAFYSICLGAALNLICNSILIPKYGALGAAYGSVIAETTVCIFQVSVAQTYIYKKQLLMHAIKTLTACAVMAGIAFILLKHIQHTVFQLIIIPAAGACIYALISILLKNHIALNIANSIKAKLPV